MASPPSAPSAETKASTKFGWRNLSLAEAALLVAVGALSLTFDLRLPARLPSESDYRQLASVLEAEAQPGDVLLVYPWWAERARLFVPDSLPVVGYLGSEQNPLVDHPRIWVLAQPHLPRANFEAFQRAFDPGRTPLGPPRWFGTLELRLYRNEKHRPLRYAATEKLGFEWHEVQYAPYRCIRVGPPGGAAKAAIDLSNVPMTGHVELNAGVIGEQASWGGPSYTPITVTAESEGQLLTNIVIPPRREGMQSSLIKTSAGELRNLTITVQTERPEGRSVCLDLRVYGEAAQ
ncbi:MAG: hypothetical protein LC775_10195 [Acidobacteria bacterium]|nr:hypothetical protein [Acidobacteriota bacterium]